jgi:dynein light chain 1|tara:strand:- start:279 stop:860 length:582 start_codon:yes stop_codon:yes gene_type:complete
MTTCSAALKAWAEEQKEAPEDAKVVKLYAQMPPISKLDNKLNDLKNVVHLSLSTNCIDRINVALALPKIRILSMGRNNLKKIEKLDGCSSTLEECWFSYNAISSLDNVDSLTKLTTLYMSNNKLHSWDELTKLAGLAELRDVLFVGNPFYDGLTPEQQRIEVLKRLPQLAKIDGVMVTPTERTEAAGGGEEDA